jgi:hypothetical protein
VSDDVKDLLSKAFGQEPPLGIDREEVLQQGRKRLRRRRFLEAGSVVALVVVVAVGAATLTNLVGLGQEDKKMPPAASSTQYAPPGPELPMSSESTPRAPVTTTTHLPYASTGEVAEDQMTALLYAVGVVNPKEASAVPHQTGVPGFRRVGDHYVYEADVVRSSTSRGYVQVTVDFSPTVILTCSNLPAPSDDCEIRTRAGLQVTLSHYIDRNGERTVQATAVTPKGVWINATASNITRHDRELDRPISNNPPVLSDDDLCNLVAKAGLGG